MDIGNKLLEQLVKQKCGHRTVKVVLERISGQNPSNSHDHETRSSLEIIPENQVTSLRNSGKSSINCSLGLNRTQRNKTKTYTHFFTGVKDSGDEGGDSDAGSDASGSDLKAIQDSSDSEFDSSSFLNKTKRKTRNLKKTSINLDHDGNNNHKNNAHCSLTTKKPKTGKPVEPRADCSICNLNIVKKHMGRHFNRKHPNEKLPPPLKHKLHQRKLKKHKTTPLQCDLCSYKCTAQKWLENHILEVHVVDKPFECEICFKSFLTENLLQNHFRRPHESRNFNCRLCPTKSFKDSTSLMEHIATVHKGYNNDHCDSEAASGSNNYLCPICDTLFLTDADMVIHLNKPKIKSEIKCEICSETVLTPCLLIVHRQKVHGKTQPISDDSSNDKKPANQVKAIVTSHDTKQGSPHSKKINEISSSISVSVKNQVSFNKFSCVACSALFSHRSDLDLHELQENHRRWKCPICAKLFHTKMRLKIHTQSVHSDLRPFGCTYQGCSKSFKLMQGLKRHITLMHVIDLNPKDDWKFKCGDCSQMFSTSQNLKQHRLTHTEDRPWPCKFCDATYKCSSEAGRHMKKCQVRSEDERKKFLRFSKATLQAAEKKKCDLTVSGGWKKLTVHQDVKIHEKFKGKLQPTSSTNELTCATTTTSCSIASAGNGKDVKLIKKEEIKHNYGSGNSFDFDNKLLLPGGETVSKLEIVPKQEMWSYSE